MNFSKSIHSIFSFILFSLVGYSQVTYPFEKVNGGQFEISGIHNSPDPLINYHWNKLNSDDDLQRYILTPRYHRTSSEKSFEFKDSVIYVSGPGDIFFDFGVVSPGWIEFESDDLNGDATVSISEHMEPSIMNYGAQHRIKTMEPAQYGKTFRLELNNQLYEGVRFAWLHVKDILRPWKLKNFRLVCQVKPTNYLGSFESNDTMLNRIWYTGAYTVKANYLKDFFGAILMERSDRHSWTGDAYTSQLASLSAFGNFDFIKKNIEFTSQQDNGILSYSILWVLGLVDYYYYTGDKAFLKSMFENARLKLEKAYKGFDSPGNLGFYGWDERIYPDRLDDDSSAFGFSFPKEAYSSYKFLCINAWKKFSFLAKELKEFEIEKEMKGFASEKEAAMLSSNPALKDLGVHAITEVVNAGLDSIQRLTTILHNGFRNRLNRLSFSPFNQYFIIQAMAKLNMYEQAMVTVKDQWGGQIQYGGTTFFEVFRPSWNLVLKPNSPPINNQCGYVSLAHPWGAGVVNWITSEILGVEPIRPGFEKFNITPHLTSNLYKVSGSVPTPHGIISVSLDLEKGNYTFIIPEGTQANLVGVPKNRIKVKNIFDDGENQKIEVVKEDNDFYYLGPFESGKYSLTIITDNKLKPLKEVKEKINYSINHFDVIDIIKPIYNKLSELKSWQGMLIPGEDMTSNVFVKPNYVDTVIYYNRNMKYQTWNSYSWDSSYTFNQSAFVTGDPVATLQTFPIDIVSKPGSNFNVYLYFIDPDSRNRISAFEIFDLRTRELLSPVQVLDDLSGGKLIGFNVRNSVRIRIYQVRGPNSALGGIFFSEK